MNQINNINNINNTNQINNTTKSRLKRNKKAAQTLKNKQLTKQNNENYYINNFYNQPSLPNTKIIKYINSHYNEYQTNVEKTKNLSFYFDIDDNFISNKNNKIINFNQSIKQNPISDLNKFLSYTLYAKSKYFFKQNSTLNISDLKEQIGKDTSRIPLFINGDSYKFISKEDENGGTSFIEKADYFNLMLINYFKKTSKNIDYNLINQIGIACCQNILNQIVDLILINMLNVLAPETCTFLNTKIKIELTLDKNTKICKRFYSSDVIISYNQELDPENSCGRFEFILVIDYIKNIYYFEKFILNYDADKCDPNYEEKQKSKINIPKMNTSKINMPKVDKDILVPFTVTGGIVATPFILGALGGKKYNKIKKIDKIKKNKTKKIKRIN